jgi:serine phosphatase RsbU (regulator of sigma subunit)
LGLVLDIDRDRSFATVLCALVDVPGRVITMVNAGHPPLLLLSRETAEFVSTTVFPPIGVRDAPSYQATAIVVPPGATIVAFTDGLVERRGESIDVSLERLRSLMSGSSLELDDLVSQILSESTSAEYSDDTAILAVRWKS